MTDYTGYQEIRLNNDELAEFYNGKRFVNLKQNEYLIVRDSDNEPIDYYKCTNGTELVRVPFPVIKNRYTNDTIKPLDPYQHCMIDMLQNGPSQLKIVRGVYGSGKDYLMFNEALAQLEKNKFQKIIYLRPNVTVAGVPDIGYLKGDIDQKLGWTLAPLYDKVGGEEGIEYLQLTEKLEMVPMPFIRGRSFENSLIYITEGQNTTSEVIKLIISRAGKDSEIWINGDNHQTDARIYDKDNGLTHAISKLQGDPLFGYCYLPISHRSQLAQLADKLDEE